MRRRRGQSGNAMVEVALMAPWIFFLFVGVLDFGFYAFALISTENAARAGAMQTAASVAAANAPVSTVACPAVWKEMNLLLNVKGTTQDCSQLPVLVVRRTLCIQASVIPNTIACDAPGCADCGSEVGAASSQVAVTYQTNNLIPIPGLLPKQLTFTRVAEMRILAK